MNTARGSQSEPMTPRVDKPDSPPVAPAIDSGTFDTRADQAARAFVASRSTDSEVILGDRFRFPHHDVIDTDVAVRQQEGLVHLDEAAQIGTGLVAQVENGTAPAVGSGEFGGRTTESLQKELESARQRDADLAAGLAISQAHLDGRTTDETGARLRGTVPRGSAGEFRRKRILTLTFFAPFEIVFGYFLYGMTVSAPAGDDQVIRQLIETVSVVGLALLVQLAAPPVIAKRIAMLRRHPDAEDDRLSNIGRWLAFGLPTAGLALLVILAASLRGLYLQTMMGEGVALPIAGVWFILFSFVLVMMPVVIVTLITLSRGYWNQHIEDVLVLQDERAPLLRLIWRIEAEVLRRRRLIDEQERITLTVVGEWADELLHGLPAKGDKARTVHIDTFVRESGDPEITDAVMVAMADETDRRRQNAADRRETLRDTVAQRIAGAEEARAARRAARESLLADGGKSVEADAPPTLDDSPDPDSPDPDSRETAEAAESVLQLDQ